MIHILPLKSWPRERRLIHWLVLALRLSIVAAIGYGLATSRWDVVALSILTLVLVLLPEMIESRVKVDLPTEFDVVLVLFIYASIFLGSIGGAYERIWWWDALLHTSAGFILSFAGFLVFYVNVLRQRMTAASPLVIGLVIFSFGMAFGGVWEIFEYGMDSLFGLNMQRSGLQDTMWDLIVNAVGAVVMSVIGVRFMQNPRQGYIAKLVRKFIRINPQLKGVKS